MTVLSMKNLGVAVAEQQILHGVDLEVASGEVHAVMGPNGAGKSTLSNAIMGKAGYQITSGSLELDGQDLSTLPTWARAQAGLFLAMQYPTEVPGVSVRETLELALAERSSQEIDVQSRLLEEAEKIGLANELLERALNVDMSGGEKKRNETAQLAVLDPQIAVLDELDSGLDIDALRACAERIEGMTEQGLGVLCITHYHRLLDYLPADHVHILVGGRIVESGGPELAVELEAEGYSRFIESDDESEGVSVAIGGRSQQTSSSISEADDPFADPLA
ncbi:MAG: Fe-S cluster assembly ATPase SufC [Acidimicrobiaceae bacterium]|nr:Fe-S cluster assembly ATPase SufC [Acidimicrobiaceae bacterium]|tara:strand:- start:29086 stop:29916 length:831 start_codon:yes stop_codon:yes gene_type:complete